MTDVGMCVCGNCRYCGYRVDRTVSWEQLVDLIRQSAPMSERDRNDDEWWETMKRKGTNGS